MMRRKPQDKSLDRNDRDFPSGHLSEQILSHQRKEERLSWPGPLSDLSLDGGELLAVDTLGKIQAARLKFKFA